MAAPKRRFPDHPSAASQDHPALRRKLSHENANGSDTSATSEVSAVVSTADEPARTLTPGTEYEDSGDESSDISSSSEEPSSESEDDEDEEASDDEIEEGDAASDGPITVRSRPKPAMRLDKDERERGKSLRERLKDFLLQLAAANEELEAERSAGTLEARNIENVDEHSQEQFIEMNLGLGVLEEKDPNLPEQEVGYTSSDSDDNDGSVNAKERDVLGKLMGHKRDGAGIQVIDE